MKTARGEKTGERPEDVSIEQRHRMIAEAAYLRAERRGFKGGDPLEDWLAAEAEIDEVLGNAVSEKEKRDLPSDEGIRRELINFFTGIRDTVDVETFKQAIDRAVREVKDAPGMTKETVNRVAETVKQELANTVRKVGPGWEAVSEKTFDFIEDWRKRSSTFFSHTSKAAGDRLKRLRKKNGGPPSHTE
jgi:hypothetical protein